MRRGHPGIGGWRSENPRHFRPRNAGTHQFGPPRPPFSMHDLPRYPHPVPRTYRCRTPFNTQHMHLDRQGPQDHHDTDYTNRSKNFRHDRGRRNTRQKPFYEGHRHNELETSSRFNDKYNYYDNVPERDMSHINSMGDIDHRQPMNNSHKKTLHKHQPWAIPPQDFKRYYHENNVKETNHYNANAEANRLTAFDSSGHRPPSSDHYGSTPRSSVENNNVFSHSVDDTVDIVRKRLLNRNDQHQTSLDQPMDEHSSVDENVPNRRRSYQNDSLEQTPKRRAPQQQVQNQMIVKKADCDKVKNKIVQTFFNMNKHGIHKLIDNPSSSAKFEYAISSLIMETQITLNSHQRSAAEKTLMSSADFIHSDKNTAFEDTFMKQMQCILDPQDTVLLEDIKPVIMAEMTKVLKLDDTEYHLDAVNPGDFLPRQEQQHYDFYANSNNNLMSLAQDSFDEMPTYEETESVNDEVDIKYDYTKQMDYVASKPLYERRPTRTSSEQSQNSQLSFDNRQHVRRSFDNPTEAMSDEPLPLFESNTELLSDDDDPFAELDNQYHVPVDHNFIENDDLSNAEQMATNSGRSPILQTDTIPNLQTSIESSIEIKKEIDDQLQSIAKSPLKLFSPSSKDEFRDQQTLHDHNSNKNTDVTTSTHDVCNNGSKPTNNMNRTQEFMDKGKDQIDNVNIMNNVPKCSTSSTRKRSIDQKPSHRKEKRKKSESSPRQTNKETLDKYITVNDKFPLNNGEDTAKTTQESVVTNNVVEVGRKYRQTEKSTKRYTEKFVKRKEIQKKSKAKEKKGEEMNRRKSTSHSLSPIDTSNTIINSETPSKANGKIKLKTIDMFIEQPKKVAMHQAHRNTAVSTSVGAAPKPTEDPKAKQQDPTPCKINKKNTLTSPCKKLNTKETQTVHGKLISRLCQTDKKKVSTKATQTDPVSSESTSRNPNTYERMKDIDLEIQALLQEKFQLYNSLESGAANPSAMQTLGMAVLNVPLETEQDGDGTEIILSEDTIVEEFTSIPVEELEQIALETVEDDNAEVQRPAARSRRVRQLEQDRESSESPSTSNTKRNNRKTKGPNISLIEQIITDDRPLEDIISLDVLEEVEKQPSRVRKRSIKSVKVPRRRVTKKAKSKVVLDNKCNLKECSVVLLREDFDNYLRAESVESESIDTEDSEEVVRTEVPTVYHEHNEEAEDSVNSFLQFDMLDVSEDIVIGDSYEMKCDDRDNLDRADVSINEEIILDNSQSSMEDLVSDASQEENECKMFDYSTDENLRRDSVLVSGHADAVLAIECVENDFIAACLDGNVYHFCSDGRLVNTLRGSNLAVTCLTIVREPHGTTVYTGSLDSRIRYYDLETGLEKGPECNVLSPIQTMDRAWDTVFVGTRTGFVLQFECKNNLLIPVSTVKFSDQSILALRALKEGPRKVLLVAARSENVTIKDAQSGLLLRTLQGPKMTVYTLLFEDGKVYCGTSSHQIHVFDYASGGHAGVHSGGKGAVCLRATGGLVFAGCYDGCVYVYREGQPRPLAQLRGPSLMLLSLAVRGSKLIVGYKDRSLYIWKIPLIILQEMIL